MRLPQRDSEALGPVIRLFRLAIAAAVATAIALPAYAQFPGPEQIAKSLVKLEVRRPNGKSIGTGFAWARPNWIVTALHVVAGAGDSDITIFSQTSSPDGSRVIDKSSGAKVLKVHHGADLALLELTESLALVPLKPAIADTAAEYEIWGFPRAIPVAKSDRVRFSRGLPTKPNFSVYFDRREDFLQQVGSDGFPKYESQILRVSDTIQPGHSGAPIINAAGQVVGIGDGGLYEGTKRINWAIPADVYLAELEKSVEARPARASNRENRFGFVVENANTPKDIEVPADVRGGTPAAQASVLFRWAWSARIGEILETADDEDNEGVREFIDDAKKEAGFDLNQAVVDIYEDDETGATIALPKGLSVSFDPERRIIRARSANQRLEMLIQVNRGEEWKDGEDARDEFDEYTESLDGDAQWKEDPDMEDEDPIDEDDYWAWEKSRIVTDRSGKASRQLFATLVIDEGDFLGTAVYVRDVQSLQREDLQLFYTMLACVELAGFTIE